jgi:hypothetical protein
MWTTLRLDERHFRPDLLDESAVRAMKWVGVQARCVRCALAEPHEQREQQAARQHPVCAVAAADLGGRRRGEERAGVARLLLPAGGALA